jgi:predicted nucleic acid-binding protein
MNVLLQNPLIQSLSVIYGMKDNEMFVNELYLSDAKEDLVLIQDFFDVEEKTAAVIAVLVCEQISGRKLNIYKTMHYLGFEPMDYLVTNGVLNEFKNNGWLVPAHQSYSSKNVNKEVFSKEVINAVISNDKALLVIKIPENIIEAMLKIGKFIKSTMKNSDNEMMVEIILAYVSNFSSFFIIESVLNNQKILNSEKVLLFYIMASTVAGAEMFDLHYDLEGFSAVDPAFQYVFKNNVRSGKSILFSEGYLNFSGAFMADFSEITIGDFLKEQLQIGLPDSEKKRPFYPKLTNVIKPDEVIEKKLYFNDEQQIQIEEVQKITSDAYDDVISRFVEKGLQPGLTILFHGDAGTGKTELVKQIAKQSNRVLLVVDLSLLQSMYVGESEKNIRRVFKEYREATAHFERTPILLFNEADAIFSKRNVVEKAVDQMLNTAQNILLQELEDFEGIFIATTNMLMNLDKAFDRRILYKLKFEKPDKSTRLAILKQNFHEINADLLTKSSANYSLTGGQIDNVKKRCITEQLLFGTETSNPEKFIFYIEQEMNFRKNKSEKIGFS